MFHAFSVCTGRTQWRLPLPRGGKCLRGVTVVSHALMSFDGAGTRQLVSDGPELRSRSRTTLPYAHVGDLRLGGVDATYGYLTYTDTVKNTGGLVRFGAISGRVIWRAPPAAAAAQVADQSLALAVGRVFVRSAPGQLTTYGLPAA